MNKLDLQPRRGGCGVQRLRKSRPLLLETLEQRVCLAAVPGLITSLNLKAADGITPIDPATYHQYSHRALVSTFDSSLTPRTPFRSPESSTEFHTPLTPPVASGEAVWNAFGTATDSHDKLSGGQFLYERTPNHLQYKTDPGTSDSYLSIRMTSEGDKFKTSSIYSNEKFLYGYYEARIRFRNPEGIWGGFFLNDRIRVGNAYSPPSSENNGAEIDVVEAMVKNRNGANVNNKYHHALHWNGYGAGKQEESSGYIGHSGFNDIKYWHTYGVLRTPDKYQFFVDRRLTTEWTTGISRIAEYLQFSQEIAGTPGQSGTFAGTVPQTTIHDTFLGSMDIDYAVVFDNAVAITTINASTIHVNGRAGVNDRITMREVGGNVVVEVGPGSSLVSYVQGVSYNLVNDSNGFPFVNHLNSMTIPSASLAGKKLIIRGLGGDDTIDASALSSDLTNALKLRIEGGPGNDILTGGQGNSAIYGQDGDDTLTGKWNNDFLSGGAGNDDLYGGDGNDTMYGNNGNDWVDGASGNDILLGGGGNDILVGGAGNDFINSLTGISLAPNVGSGDDIVIGGHTTFAGSTPLFAAQRAALIARWNVAAKYAERVAALQNEGVTVRGKTIRLNGASVVDGDSADKLFGGSGLDWFFSNAPGTEVLDEIAAESLVKDS